MTDIAVNHGYHKYSMYSAHTLIFKEVPSDSHGKENYALFSGINHRTREKIVLRYLYYKIAPLNVNDFKESFLSPLVGHVINGGCHSAECVLVYKSTKYNGIDNYSLQDRIHQYNKDMLTLSEYSTYLLDVSNILLSYSQSQKLMVNYCPSLFLLDNGQSNLHLIYFGYLEPEVFQINNPKLISVHQSMIPPETVNYDIYNDKSMIYCAGILLYYILTSKYISIEEINSRKYDIPLEMSDMKQEYFNLFDNMLQQDPNNRFSINDLNNYLNYTIFQINNKSNQINNNPIQINNDRTYINNDPIQINNKQSPNNKIKSIIKPNRNITVSSQQNNDITKEFTFKSDDRDCIPPPCASDQDCPPKYLQVPINSQPHIQTVNPPNQNLDNNRTNSDSSRYTNYWTQNNDTKIVYPGRDSEFGIISESFYGKGDGGANDLGLSDIFKLIQDPGTANTHNSSCQLDIPNRHDSNNGSHNNDINMNNFGTSTCIILPDDLIPSQNSIHHNDDQVGQSTLNTKKYGFLSDRDNSINPNISTQDPYRTFDNLYGYDENNDHQYGYDDGNQNTNTYNSQNSYKITHRACGQTNYNYISGQIFNSNYSHNRESNLNINNRNVSNMK